MCLPCCAAKVFTKIGIVTETEDIQMAPYFAIIAMSKYEEVKYKQQRNKKFECFCFTSLQFYTAIELFFIFRCNSTELICANAVVKGFRHGTASGIFTA